MDIAWRANVGRCVVRGAGGGFLIGGDDGCRPGDCLSGLLRCRKEREIEILVVFVEDSCHWWSFIAFVSGKSIRMDFRKFCVYPPRILKSYRDSTGRLYQGSAESGNFRFDIGVGFGVGLGFRLYR